jgi:hypothetical protein
LANAIFLSVPTTANSPFFEFDIALCGLREMRRDAFGLGLDPIERLVDRRHADCAQARPVGAHAELDLVGMAMNNAHLVERDAEALGHQLSERSFVALAVAVMASAGLAGRHNFSTQNVIWLTYSIRLSC